MGLSRIKIALVIVGLAVASLLLYPRKEVLIPAMTIQVRYEGGDLVANGEVCRTWNHYLGSGWSSQVGKTDSSGRVSFPKVERRVPLLLSNFWSSASTFLHYYPGLAGDIVARDANNHYIWQRVDFSDKSCCPTEVPIFLHDEQGEADDRYFAFEATSLDH